MYTITKTFHFSAAHRLMQYDGPCRFVHGHNFIITITLQADQPVDQKNGFLVDFKQINIFKEFVEQKYDHAFLTQKDDEIGQYLQSQGHKVVFFDLPPSTEHLAKHFFDEFGHVVTLPQWVSLQNMYIQETPTAWASRSVS